MQLAGASCSFCERNILMTSDGSWCAGCSTIFHRQCLAEANYICPTCRTKYDPPESYSVFSETCPECSRPNVGPHPNCESCGASTLWNNKAAYDDFRAHMRDTARVCILRGIAELIGGCACFLALLAAFYVSVQPGFLGPALFLFGFMALTTDGILTLMKSRRIVKFR
jgi:hypothetical protein